MNGKVAERLNDCPLKKAITSHTEVPSLPGPSLAVRTGKVVGVGATAGPAGSKLTRWSGSSWRAVIALAD